MTHYSINECGSLADILDLLMSNPQIQQFLTSLGMSTAKEAGEKIGKWVVDSITTKIRDSKLFGNQKIKAADELLNGLISKKPTGITLLTNYWLEFLTFMFPDREITIDKLNQSECDYIAQRIFTGLGFEQLLLDMGYRLEKIRYMTYFPGLQSRAFHYFDLAANFEQEYFDNVLCARVIDIRVSSPQDFVNSLPRVVSDINGDPYRPPILRDHDIVTIIISNDLSTSRLTKFRQTIRTVQETNIILPRLILIANQELSELLRCKNQKERGDRMRRKLQEVRLYRGVVE